MEAEKNGCIVIIIDYFDDYFMIDGRYIQRNLFTNEGICARRYKGNVIGKIKQDVYMGVVKRMRCLILLLLFYCAVIQ